MTRKSKRTAITDKERLDWLGRNEWDFFKHDAAQLYVSPYSFARATVRQAIDAAIRATQEKPQ